MQADLRNWEYYNMTETFSSLFEDAKNKTNFNRLYDIITSRNNILLAYRTIKSNKGSKTPGTDRKTIENVKALTEKELVELIQVQLANYRPKKVRRVYIPKPNGDKRPLGIPCIIDRIIQQCFKQVLEPIVEAQFYNHSYGFRPLRNAHHAVARVQHLINRGYCHYAVDIDIKSFFDNVNHTKLIKQLWNMGIRDKKVLRIIMKMLKSRIDEVGIPTKGTPQGGIISPLLSNIVLNDLDHWISNQWENFETKNKYSRHDSRYIALKKTNLKEGFIVRYADDFKILCKDWKTAQKWFHAIRLYLRDRLGLEINHEKSEIVNLRKRSTNFLGFTIRAFKKKGKHVAKTGISEKKKLQIKQKARELINNLRRSPLAVNAIKYNSFVLGIHNYFKKATHVNKEFSRIFFDLSKTLYNRLRLIGYRGKPNEPPPTYQKFYKNNFKTYRVAGTWLFPIADISTCNNMNFSQDTTPYTEKGREKIKTKLAPTIAYEIRKLMEKPMNNNEKFSVEYYDNRLSRYSMVKGKCEVTGIFLNAEDVHCHHKIPFEISRDNSYENLKIVNKLIHRLIHATSQETINKYMKIFQLDRIQIKKLNNFRKYCGLELIS